MKNKAIAYYIPIKNVWRGRVLTYGLDGSLLHGEDAGIDRPTFDLALQDAKSLAEIDKRHGSPYDRGSADRYYRRPYEPHYYTGASYQSDRIEEADMTPEQIRQYKLGWDEEQDRKDWGEGGFNVPV